MGTSTVPTVKTSMRTWLATLTGLRPQDGVAISSATMDPAEIAVKHVILGDVTAPQEWAGLGAQRKTETPRITGHINITKPGAGEDAIDAARDDAYALLGVIETGLRGDPTAGGCIPNPNITAVTSVALEEAPVDPAGRLAKLTFVITYQARI